MVLIFNLKILKELDTSIWDFMPPPPRLKTLKSKLEEVDDSLYKPISEGGHNCSFTVNF